MHKHEMTNPVINNCLNWLRTPVNEYNDQLASKSTIQLTNQLVKHSVNQSNAYFST